MDKKDLINLISDTFCPVGFKHKGNYWMLREIELTKMINLQKSNFGNYFYINYGFILNKLDRDGLVAHVFERLASNDKEEQTNLTNCLNLDYEILEQKRISILKKLMNDKVLKKIQGVSSELELVEYIKKRPQMNDIPLSVKKYLNL